MKRFLALAALVLGLVSCQNDFDGANHGVGGEVDFTLEVAVPELATRANAGSDSAEGGLTNINLNGDYDIRYILEVYDANDELAKERFTNYEDKSSTTAFNLRLIPGRKYSFVVWADFVPQVNVARDPESNYDYHYNTSAGLKNVQLANVDWTAMDESRDAYTGVAVENEFKSSSSIKVELHRPFAKLRVVTTDIKDLFNLLPEDVTVTYTSKLYTSFNALKETAGELATTNAKSIKLSENLYSDEDPRATGKMTIFTDYFFGAEDDRVMFTMDVKDDKGGVIPQIVFNTNIPVKRNYLTTVMGPVLTDSNNITVTIDDTFENGTEWNPEEDKYDVEVWDGKTLTEPTYNEDDSVYEIGAGSQFAWLAAAVNGTLPSTSATRAGVNYATQKYVLTNDIDLGNCEWTPIGIGGKRFSGSIDGQGHTIKNYRITKNHGDKEQAALIANVALTVNFENIVIDNAYVKYPEHGKDFYGAALIGTAYGNVTIKNVTVKNSYISGNNKVAALIAHDGVVSSLNIDGCVVDSCYIATENEEDGGNVGGVVGLFQGVAKNDSVAAPYGEHVIKNTVVKNCEIVAINSSNSGKRANSQFVGGVISKVNQTLVIENCSVENNTYTETFVHEEGVADYVGGYDNKFVGGDREGKYLGVVVINGTRYEATEEPKNVSAEDGEWYATVAEAIEAGNSEIVLGEGEFKMPAEINDGAVIEGNGEDTVLDMSSMNGKNYNNVTFRNLTINESTGNYNGIQHSENLKYEDCVLNGVFFLYATSEFTRCTFNIEGDAYNVWTYGATKATFNECTFNSDGKSLLIYNEGGNGSDVTFNNCVFNSNGKSFDGKAAIEIDSSLLKDGMLYNVYINECTVNGFANGSVSKSNVYNPKKGAKANIYVDGNAVVLYGYEVVANYAGLFTKDGEYFVFDAEGLMSLNQYFKKNWGANHIYQTYNIAADIDATGYTWDGVFIVTGNNAVNGLILNGNNHTISNLTINNFLLSGTPNGGDEGTTPGQVKNITMDNITVNGSSHDATVFWGSCNGDVNYENVVVKNSTIKGGSNVGALMSRTTIENDTTKVYVNFKNCKVENCKISAYNLNADPTGASGFVGRAYGNTYMTFNKCSVDAATTVENAEGLVGGRAYGYGVWKDGGWKGVGASDGFVKFDGVNIVGTDSFEDLKGGVNAGDEITLTDDVEGAGSNGGYSKAGFTHNGGVLDGGMNELLVTEANGTWDCAIYTNGGTIKNFALIGGAFRGIFTAGLNNDLYIDNVTIDKTCYTFNSDDGNKQYGVYISNSTLNGWTSYGDNFKEVVFTNCKFGKGTGGYQYACCRPYNASKFVNCEFDEGFEFDATRNGNIVFVNCTYNGVHITKDNVTKFLGDSAANIRFE